MLNESLITERLASLGYQRVKRLAYKASWSTPDVEHFLYFSLYGAPKEFLTADFGLRNADADAFGVKCILAYGSDVYRLMKHDARIHCSMRFSLGLLAAWGGSRTSLYLPEMSMASLAEKISDDIDERLFPVIRGVTSLNRLFSLLLDDAEPCPWARVNGAIRMAQVAYLGRRLDMAPAYVRANLKFHERQIVADLGEGADWASYIDRIIEDAANTVSA